jgi:hypothetical protein
MSLRSVSELRGPQRSVTFRGHVRSVAVSDRIAGGGRTRDFFTSVTCVLVSGLVYWVATGEPRIFAYDTVGFVALPENSLARF